MKRIAAIPTTGDPSLLTESVARATRSRSVRIQSRLFYPYYFFQYRLRGKRLFAKVHSRIGCTVDLISGREALADTPFEPRPETVSREWILEAAITEARAREQARSYVCAAVSMKMKWFRSVELRQERSFLYYRPFWLVACEERDKDPVWIIVDGVSGRFHPLPLEENPRAGEMISQAIPFNGGGGCSGKQTGKGG